MVRAQTYNPGTVEGGAELLPRDFKTTSGYEVSSRPAWARIRPLSKQTSQECVFLVYKPVISALRRPRQEDW